MTPFFVQKGTELFEALLICLRSKRNSRRFAITEKRNLSLPALSAFFAAYSIAAAFLLAKTMEQELVDATTAEHWLKALDATTALEPFVDPALVDKRVQSSYPGDKVLPALREFREK